MQLKTHPTNAETQRTQRGAEREADFYEHDSLNVADKKNSAFLCVYPRPSLLHGLNKANFSDKYRTLVTLYIGVIAAIVVGSFVVIFIFSALLQGIIVKPELRKAKAP